MFPILRRPPLAVLLGAASLLAAAPSHAQSPPEAPAASASYLSLSEALARAARLDPSTAAQVARLRAAEAAIRQAGVRPMAAVALELENFAGSGPYSLFDRAEATLSYERRLERGGKREARTHLAVAELDTVRLRAQVRRADFLKEVQLAYAEALAAEAELLIAEARLIASLKSQSDIERRVRSARDPLFAGSRAEALTAQAEIARDRARATARTRKTALAAYLGLETDFSFRLEDFFEVEAPPIAVVDGDPDLALLEAERQAAEAAVRLARTQDAADPTVRAGMRYTREGSDVALIVGGSIPLGPAAANRANVARAAAEAAASEQDVAAARLIRQRRATQLRAYLAALAAEAEQIGAEVIPLALRTVDQVTDGFNRGGFQYIDVTEAERALADTRARRVEVLREFHTTKAELDRLTGAHAALVDLIEERR